MSHPHNQELLHETIPIPGKPRGAESVVQRRRILMVLRVLTNLTLVSFLQNICSNVFLVPRVHALESDQINFFSDWITAFRLDQLNRSRNWINRGQSDQVGIAVEGCVNLIEKGRYTCFFLAEGTSCNDLRVVTFTCKSPGRVGKHLQVRGRVPSGPDTPRERYPCC